MHGGPARRRGADSRASSTVGPSYQGAASERSTTLSPFSAEIGITVHEVMPSRWASASMLVDDALVGGAVPLDEVHLVGADDQLVDTEQRRDADVSAGLLAQAGGRVDQDEREVGRRGPGGHVAGVLDVAGAVGDDVLAVSGVAA